MNTSKKNDNLTEDYDSLSYKKTVRSSMENISLIKDGFSHITEGFGDLKTATFIKEGHLPTQIELTQIAATLKQSQSLKDLNPKGLVSYALDMWKESHKKLIKEHVKIEGLLKEVNNFSNRTKPIVTKRYLKIGSHYLPPVEDSEFLSPAKIPYDKFLTITTGLSRKEDQTLWFRSFLEAQYRLKRYREEYPEPEREIGVAYKPKFNAKKCPTVEDYPISEDDDTVQNTITYLRENGIESRISGPLSDYKNKPHPLRNIFDCLPSSRIMLVQTYRYWRLNMKTAKTPCKKKRDIWFCEKKGLEWSEKIKNCISEQSE